MMIITLHLTPTDRERIAAVQRHAEQHIVGLETLRALASREPLPLPGDDEDFVVHLPPCRVVFSLEEQECGRCRHLSVSVAGGATWPSPALVQAICREFGFAQTLDRCLVWREGIAINVLEPVCGRWPENTKDQNAKEEHERPN